MKSLREYIADAQSHHVALGHFNISNSDGLWGIFRAAKNLNLPVIIGTSEGERDFLGVRQAVALVRSIREEYDYPIFLNADHTYSFEKVKEAVDAGYDAVIFDGAKLPLEENIVITKQCVAYAHSINPDILVEGELGYIGTSSQLLDEIPAGAAITEELFTTPEELEWFVRETGVDLVAPAVGNLHGMLASGHNPRLSIERVALLRNRLKSSGCEATRSENTSRTGSYGECLSDAGNEADRLFRRFLKEAGGVSMVLHGGSGITDEDFTAAIKAGIAIVHINTEIRVAYRKALALSLQENPDEIAPYKLLKGAVQGVQKITEERLKLFNSIR